MHSTPPYGRVCWRLQNVSSPWLQVARAGIIRMRNRNGWLFPLMVVAAGSVMAFGCIGIAAITGHLPLTRARLNPLGDYMAAPAASIEQAVLPQPQAAAAQPVAVVAVEGRTEATKAVAFQPGKPAAVRKRPSERTLN
jgi:hypothetical protein